MSNTINVNYMTRACNQYQQKIVAKDQEKEDTRFADSVREKSEASGSIVGNSKIGSVSAKDMTMVEYKQYIYNKISQIPMHPTRAGESISVTISEAGFEATQATVSRDIKDLHLVKVQDSTGRLHYSTQTVVGDSF